MDSGTDLFFDEGLHFECVSCGHCCRHEPGNVFLSKKDLLRLASFKNMSEKDFVWEYCRTVYFGSKTYLSLNETYTHDCVFWNEGCTVYQARPLQCQAYPFWPSVLSSETNWNNEKKYCPGIGTGELKKKDCILKTLEKMSREEWI